MGYAPSGATAARITREVQATGDTRQWDQIRDSSTSGSTSTSTSSSSTSTSTSTTSTSSSSDPDGPLEDAREAMESWVTEAQETAQEVSSTATGATTDAAAGVLESWFSARQTEVEAAADAAGGAAGAVSRVFGLPGELMGDFASEADETWEDVTGETADETSADVFSWLEDRLPTGDGSSGSDDSAGLPVGWIAAGLAALVAGAAVVWGR